MTGDAQTDDSSTAGPIRFSKSSISQSRWPEFFRHAITRGWWSVRGVVTGRRQQDQEARRSPQSVSRCPSTSALTMLVIKIVARCWHA